MYVRARCRKVDSQSLDRVNRGSDATRCVMVFERMFAVREQGFVN